MPHTRRAFFIGAAAAPLAASFAAGPERKLLLSGKWPETKLAAAILPRASFRPFSPASDRAGWDSLPAGMRAELITAGERNLKSEWPGVPATMILEFVTIGVRENADRVRSRKRDRLRELVIAECAENKDRFLGDITNGLWSVCEETYWGSPAHLNAQKAGSGLPDAEEPTVDLFSAETAALLAWTDYLIGPKLEKSSKLLRPRIWYEVNRRVLTPCFDRIDFSWMGLDPERSREVNNWNPWINSNWLTSTLLLERDEKRRVRSVRKILTSLDRFLDSYHEDGGCDEGPGYWNRAGGSLCDCLELLNAASRGAIDFYSMPLVREIGRYIYRAHIHNNWYLNFADASARINIAGDVVYRYGKRIGDEKMMSLGARAEEEAGRGGSARGDSIGRQLPALFNRDIRSAKGAQPLVRDVWLPGIQVFAARMKEGSPEGLYLAAQGGHNAESHNHNDVGNFVVYAGGEPLIIDIGVETYTAKTFSKDRYTIWTMQSAYHNCPTVDGQMELAGREYAASSAIHHADDRVAELSLNIENAFGPEAGIDTWKRTYRLDRTKNAVEIREDYSLKKPAGVITLTLMTAGKPTQKAPGVVDLAGKAVARYDPQVFRPKIEQIALKDGRLRSAWGDTLWRILLVAGKPPRKAAWTTTITQS